MIGNQLRGQIEIQAKELTEKQIRALKKEKQQAKQTAHFKARGYNQYGIDENAQSWAEALRYYTNSTKQQNGIPILRVSKSINTGKTFPLWDFDGNIYEFPPHNNYFIVREVQVLETLADTNRYGQKGRAGVIKIKTSEQ